MKHELRSFYRKRRAKITPLNIKKWSNRIAGRILRLKTFRDAGSVACFVSCGNEVDTYSLLLRTLELGKIVSVPVTAPGLDKTFFSQIKQISDIDAAGVGGIPEPSRKNWRRVNLEKIDFVVVPGLVFDRRGYRLGYGAGVYDKLLSGMPNAIRVGVAFSSQLTGRLPRGIHDLPVDMVVTEKGIVRCKAAHAA